MNKFNHMAKLIFKIRKDEGLSQEEFKNLFDSSKKNQYVSNMERGLASLPVKYHAMIAEKVKVSRMIFKDAFMSDVEDNYDRRVK